MTPPTGYFVDANLLVLLVTGSVDRELIARHRRLRRFTAADYDVLRRMAHEAGRVFVTPNTLTEASNLLAQHREPDRSHLLDGLRALIEESEEIVVRSAEASSNAEYVRLGLTDAALLEAVTADTPVLTVDLDLYRAAWRKQPDAAVNFAQYRGP